MQFGGYPQIEFAGIFFQRGNPFFFAHFKKYFQRGFPLFF
jgi:hypothetical protein